MCRTCPVSFRERGVLLILLGSALFLCGAFFFLIRPTAYFEQRVPLSLWGSTDYTLGEYYFNHNDGSDEAYDLRKAQFFYERSIAKNPKGNEHVWYQSGRIDFIEGRFDTALYKFKKQVEYFGDHVPNVYYMSGLTYAYRGRVTGNAEDWARAEEDFQKSLVYFAQAPWPYVDLAWVYFSQGKFESMKPLLETSFTVDSNNPWLLNMYGLALLNTGQTELAHAYFLFAQEEAAKVTRADWGRIYPGNNPLYWEQGLLEFRSLIAENVRLSQN